MEIPRQELEEIERLLEHDLSALEIRYAERLWDARQENISFRRAVTRPLRSCGRASRLRRMVHMDLPQERESAKVRQKRHVIVASLAWCPRMESNHHQQLRRLLHYPLCYGDLAFLP